MTSDDRGLRYSVTYKAGAVLRTDERSEAFDEAKRLSEIGGDAAVYDRRQCLGAYVDGEFHSAPAGTRWQHG